MHSRRKSVLRELPGVGLYVLTVAVELLLAVPIRWALAYLGAATIGAFVALGLGAEVIASIVAFAPLAWSILGLIAPGRGRVWRRRLGARRASADEASSFDQALTFAAGRRSGPIGSEELVRTRRRPAFRGGPGADGDAEPRADRVRGPRVRAGPRAWSHALSRRPPHRGPRAALRHGSAAVRVARAPTRRLPGERAGEIWFARLSFAMCELGSPYSGGGHRPVDLGPTVGRSLACTGVRRRCPRRGARALRVERLAEATLAWSG
jgi:hypothetical protein